MKKLLGIFATVAILASPAWAGEPGTATKIEETVVTATREEARSIDVPASVDVITRIQIEQSGAINLGDLMGKFTTGHLHKYSGMLTSVGMRGFKTESHGDDLKGYVLILVDGHRMGTGNAAKIDVSRIERVEVIKGPVSALYGSAAMGGVVNVITREGEGKIETRLTQEFGSFDYLKSIVSSGGRINDKWAYHATASYMDLDDYDDPVFGTVYNTAETQKRIGGNISFDPAENHMFRLGFDWGDLTGGSPSWANYDTYSAYVEDAVSEYDKSHGYADLEYNGSYLDEKLKWRAMVYYLWDRNHWSYGDPDPDLTQSKYTDETWGTDHQVTWEFAKWHRLLVGVTYEELEKESEGVSAGLPSLPYTPGMEYESRALFIQDSMDFMDNRLNVVLAARYDRFDVKTNKPLTGELLSIEEREEDFDYISPKAGVGMKFFDEMLRVRSNVGVGFKAPSADQLSAMYEKEGWKGVDRILGNPDLDPETSLTWDVGFDVYLGYADIEVTWFHTDYEDKIVDTNVLYDGKTWKSWENSGDATIQGFDLNLTFRISELFDWEPDVSLYSRMTWNIDYEDEEKKEDLLYISEYEIKSGVNVKYGAFGGAVSHVLVGPQMITNFDTYMDEEKGTFSFWDLNLSWQVGDHLEMKADLLNIFDQRYEWVRGYIMPERNVRFAVTYKF